MQLLCFGQTSSWRELYLIIAYIYTHPPLSGIDLYFYITGCLTVQLTEEKESFIIKNDKTWTEIIKGTVLSMGKGRLSNPTQKMKEGRKGANKTQDSEVFHTVDSIQN